MPRRTAEFHPDAVAEANAAAAWYAERNPALRRAFIAELDRAVDSIRKSPEGWPGYEAGTRRYLMRRFPFMVVYREIGSTIQIVAVAHTRRRPGYWKTR